MTYSNEMAAHIWAQQTEHSGKSSNGNLNFSGRTIRSYLTPIAYYGERAILVTTRIYSMTTSGKHMPAVHRALGYGDMHAGLPVYHVPNLAENDGAIAANMAYLVERYSEAVASARRATLRTDWRISEMERTARAAIDYARTYGLDTPAIDVTADIAAVQAHHAARVAKANTPAALARKAKAQARRTLQQAENDGASTFGARIDYGNPYGADDPKHAAWECGRARAVEADRLARLEGAEKLEAWRNGAAVSLPYTLATDGNGGALLRVRGDRLETSMGATVPLADAITVFRAVARLRNTDRAATEIVWQRNSERLDVGAFTVDRIFADGSFRAGCHLIHWPEIERAAIAAGVHTER